MNTYRRLAGYTAAIIAIVASSAFTSAFGNHYILPCGEECNPTSIPIGPAMTGVWIDPTQSGHGFIIEILPGEPLRMAVRWYVFEPQGGQSWIAADGAVADKRAILTGYRITGNGGRFPPNFDPAGVVEEPWGTLTFSFRDCSHGFVAWVASAPGYASGGMDLVRLTLPAGLACADEGTAARGAGGIAP